MMNGTQAAEDRRPSAFTLIEVLVTLSIISLLLALLIPSLRSVRERSRAFACQSNLRGVAFDFEMFADPNLHGPRGDDAMDDRLSGRQFWLETFQESQYRIDEFWDRSGSTYQGPVESLGVMACAAVDGEITLRNSTPCRSGAVQPPQAVSFAFNLRLDHPEVKIKGSGSWGVQRRPLSDRVLSVGQGVPLLWDIDGAAAANRFVTPHYSAPPGDPEAPYADGTYWFPSLRHDGRMNVAFVSGEVLASDDPINERSWRWEYAP